MDRLEILEEKINSVSRVVASLRDKSDRFGKECGRLRQENELLSSENKMVRKLMTELDRMRDERRLVKAKCEKLLSQYERLKV